MRRIVLITFVVFSLIHFPNFCSAEVWQNDFTQDGIVNFLDFAKIASSWQKTDSDPNWCGLYDLFEDGNINFNDLTIFVENWLCLNNITLEVYSDGWGNLLRTITLEKEGPITIYATEEYPYYDPPRYCIYASRAGAYTEIYNCQFGDTIDVDLDNIQKNKLNGTIFMTQYWFADRYLSNTTVSIKNQNIIIAQFQTNSQGRFSIDNIEPGEYYFLFTNWNHAYNVKVIIGELYQDFFFGDYIQAFKPNIYLYPEQTTQLDVDIVFPHGGCVTESIPNYVDGWHVTIEPSGLIDGEYRYLFYESLQEDACQYSSGWVIACSDLETFFRDNMAQTGFIEQEIDDFIEYWIPKLKEYPYYAIYPQYNKELDEMIQLKFSTEPANLIRVMYALKGLKTNTMILQAPVIPLSSRSGFTVAEWGVILQ